MTDSIIPNKEKFTKIMSDHFGGMILTEETKEDITKLATRIVLSELSGLDENPEGHVFGTNLIGDWYLTGSIKTKTSCHSKG